ncbi:MAG: Rieske 2Fe-2S domain-containing protein, partial [Myxococcota bacterium]
PDVAVRRRSRAKAAKSDETKSNHADSSRGLPPFPRGWYVLAFSSELEAGQIRHGSFGGRELIVYRTETGRAVVSSAFCPHLGAHLGHGGTVHGETVRCPFHGFRFDPRGRCVEGYPGRRPAKAELPSIPVLERNRMILGWLDPSGGPPAWDIPELLAGQDDRGYGRFYQHTWPTLRSHPQETTENSVDIGHLSAVHEYRDVAPDGPLTTVGPYLHARYRMRRKNPFVPGQWVEAFFEVHVHGLGFSYVETRVPGHGLLLRNFVLPTPLDGQTIALRAAAAFDFYAPQKMMRPLGWLPRSLFSAVASFAGFEAYKRDLSQDFRIWENKRYVHPPRLADGDGPIGRYRKWCQQFYV